MLFDTPVYFIFLITVVVVYWRLSHRNQNALLLAASYFFYGWWDWRFLLLMIASTAIDYAIACKIEDADSPAKRKALLVLSLLINFSVLGFFKYFNFFLNSAANGLELLGIHSVSHRLLAVVLPPGISFYTFQEVAYIVDVYGRRIRASRNPIEYGLFISLFPHLIAGPIQRPSHLLPQVQNNRTFDTTSFRNGCMLILTGLIRKTVIADNCAYLANAAFAGKLGRDGWATLIGVYAFAWQIYGDFSGYSDIARGSAQVLGFHFMVNFRQPYLATGLQDFWRRWHISLSTWLRDYLYIPMGGNRGSEKQTYRNIILTMLIGGLWHGANWTFVLWGWIHGFALSVERFVFGRNRVQLEPTSLQKWIRRAIVFNTVCFAWIFFRAETISGAMAIIARMGHFQWSPDYRAALLFLGILAGLGLLIDLELESTGGEHLFERGSTAFRLGAVASAVVLVLLFAATDENAFIYFQF
jgi:D-alanyl-lipoteichoic acid acyltransferase DltB (MBOAT superfamily)